MGVPGNGRTAAPTATAAAIARQRWLLAALAAAVAASPLRPASLRETALLLVGIAVGIAVTARDRGGPAAPSWSASSDDDGGGKHRSAGDGARRQHTIRTIEELRSVLPAGRSGTSLEDAKKVVFGHLDDQMIRFIEASPLLYLATVDTTTTNHNHAPTISPKGDKPGFVGILRRPEGHTLVLPDRPGNRLLFGLQNIVSSGNSNNNNSNNNSSNSNNNNNNAGGNRNKDAPVSILFEVPGTGTTLRCGGTARVSTDPELLSEHSARGCAPRVVVLVDIEHAFFHCAKAYMRSGVWDPSTWPQKPLAVCFGRYFAGGNPGLARAIDEGVEKHYGDVQKAIDGESCETEA